MESNHLQFQKTMQYSYLPKVIKFGVLKLQVKTFINTNSFVIGVLAHLERIILVIFKYIFIFCLKIFSPLELKKSVIQVA